MQIEQSGTRVRNKLTDSFRVQFFSGSCLVRGSPEDYAPYVPGKDPPIRTTTEGFAPTPCFNYNQMPAVQTPCVPWR